MPITTSISLSTMPNIPDLVDGSLRRAAMIAGERLLALSLEEVPMDVGNPGLAGSGTVEGSPGREPGAEVVYNIAYATRLHEHPEYNFSTKANPGAKGKYLEDPALANRDELGAIIATEVQRG